MPRWMRSSAGRSAIGALTVSRRLTTPVARLAALRDPDAPIELVTVHGTKGREWPTVVILGLEDGSLPEPARPGDAADRSRALEEERRPRLRGRHPRRERLILAYDPASPSRFARS